MSELLQKIASCVEAGKVDKTSPFPPAMKGHDGADELTLQALEAGLSVEEILEHGLMSAMEKVGNDMRDGVKCS